MPKPLAPTSAGARKHSGLVELEHFRFRVDLDGHRLLHQRLHQRAGAVAGDVHEAGDGVHGDADGASALLARDRLWGWL